MARTTIDQNAAPQVLRALELAYEELNAQGLRTWNEKFQEVIYQCRCSLEVEGLEEIRPIVAAMLGYDPLVQAKSPDGDATGTKRSTKEQPPSLQDLRRKIYTKAKAEPAWRFWGLYVHVAKMETLCAAYRLAKANNGAPGIDGVTFAAIEKRGVGAFLGEIRDELVRGTYRPLRNRHREIPKDGGKKTRVLSIPTIRDRVVQGALKLILEPIFEADFQPGSFGYRPKRTAHEAVERVAVAIAMGKTRVIDLDLKAYFDNVRHHILLAKVTARVNDCKVLRLLKLILKASGKKGVPQGGVISPLLSNIYLNAVDAMLEKAREKTRRGKHLYVEYARYADDMVILVDPSHERGNWLLEAVSRRLREELAKLQVAVNEDKTKTLDLSTGEGFDFLGFTFHRRRSAAGKWCPIYTPRTKKRTELLGTLKEVFRRHRSQPIDRVIQVVNPILRGWVNYFRFGHAGACFAFIRLWVEKKVRRHLMRAQQRSGFGWKRWSSQWYYERLGLFGDYKARGRPRLAKALTEP